MSKEADCGGRAGRVRLYVDAGLGAGASVTLAREQAHYLIRVMRLAAGDAVRLFNGRDGEWRAAIADAGRNACVLSVERRLRAQAAGPDVWLAFAPLKKARTDFLVEKATELGAARLLPVTTRHTDSQRVRADRLRAQAVEAAEQCERLDVPDVAGAQALDALLAAWPVDRRLYVPDETGGGRPLADVLARDREAAPGAPAGFLVGPEGGFASGELDALSKLSFVTAVGLGPRILRAETAALAALACWQVLTGDGGMPPPR